MTQRMETPLNTLGLRVADHVPAMLAYWDKDLICRFANSAYLDWFGKSREEMIDKIHISDLLGPLYQKNVPYITNALRGEKQVFERDITTPSGEIRHSLATYIPDIVNGVVEGFFVHVADVTSLKELEKKLVKTNHIILEQNKRLLNFANIVSHNLRSYSGNLGALLELYKTAGTEEDKRDLMGHLKSLSLSFTSTVNNLDEIVHAQNLSNLKYEQVSIRDYADKVIYILRNEIEKNHAIVVNEADPGLRLMANPAYIESILLNLLSNAIRYRHPDRIPEISISTFASKSESGIIVKDNGLGMDLEKFGKDIFGLYKTFHSHPQSKGIGLFITKFQVESMGGRIEIESSVNKGSTFRITFSA